MTMKLTSFDQALLADNPVYLLRGSSSGFVELTDTGIGTAYKIPNNDGAQLVQSEGVFCKKSFRFDGGNVASGSNYLTIKAGPAIKPNNALTLLLLFGALRDAPPPVSKGQISLYGGYANSGYVCALLSNGQIGFTIKAGNSARMLYFDSSVLSDSINLMHFTYDGRVISAYVNGNLVSSDDLGATYTINNNLYDIFIAANMNPTGGVDSSIDFADIDVSHFSIYDKALTAAQISEQYSVLTSFKKVSGTALLDNGSPASAVRISSWASSDVADVIPQSNGVWSAAVPGGDYLVTALGPSGYRPMSHGPITAVAP